MTREYKVRSKFDLVCPDCSTTFSTNSYRAIRCKPCAKSADYRKHMLDYKWRINKLIAMAKNRAKEKNLPFDLTKEYMIGLWDGTAGICPISDREFDLNSWGNKGQVNPNAPSIDRINPKLGYVQGNVRFVIYHINVAISEYGLDMFKALIKDVR